jgi:hypothetical protein
MFFKFNMRGNIGTISCCKFHFESCMIIYQQYFHSIFVFSFNYKQSPNTNFWMRAVQLY